MFVALDLTPSRRLACAIAVGHGVAAAALFVTALGPLALAAGLCFIAAGWRRAHRYRSALSSRYATIRLEIGTDGTVCIVRRDGTVHAGRALAGSYVSPGLTVVRFRPTGRRLARSVVIATDSADPEAQRRLRVLLRWSAI